jgi:hypothetical protein
LNLNTFNKFEEDLLTTPYPKFKKIADMIYWQGIVAQEIPNKNRIIGIRIGVIYTLPKKKKLDKTKKTYNKSRKL